MVLAVVLLVTAGAAAYSVRQQHKYRATAAVLLNDRSLAASLTGIQDRTTSEDPARLAATQANLADTPTVAAGVLQSTALAGSRSVQSFLAASNVKAESNADILDFQVTDPNPVLASRLATAYARQYTVVRRQLDTSGITNARQDVEQQLAKLGAQRQRKSGLYASLVGKDQQLRTLAALQTSNASVIRTAGAAEQVQPLTARNIALGVALGLVLGLGAAFLREALDTRVRTSEAASELLRLPILGRLPAPPRGFRGADRLVMLERAQGPESEAFRMLRTNLEFANLERRARLVMVTSAVIEEGKTTTAANLAVALAASGQHVVLVDLDLRRPRIARLFDVECRPGVTDVVLGHLELEEALTPITLGSRNGASAANGATPATNGAAPTGELEVLGSGPLPLNPGELIGSQPLSRVLGQLASRADFVIVDCSPLLVAGDALTLSARVDAIMVVARVNRVRRHTINELRRVLDTSPAEKLGVVLTGSSAEDEYGSAYGYHYHRPYEVAEHRDSESQARHERREVVRAHEDGR
jgi:Mrp family chromosome partitioning ATPase/capsular polysaccharide biosynthesis protein